MVSVRASGWGITDMLLPHLQNRKTDLVVGKAITCCNFNGNTFFSRLGHRKIRDVSFSYCSPLTPNRSNVYRARETYSVWIAARTMLDQLVQRPLSRKTNFTPNTVGVKLVFRVREHWASRYKIVKLWNGHPLITNTNFEVLQFPSDFIVGKCSVDLKKKSFKLGFRTKNLTMPKQNLTNYLSIEENRFE